MTAGWSNQIPCKAQSIRSITQIWVVTNISMALRCHSRGDQHREMFAFLSGWAREGPTLLGPFP